MGQADTIAVHRHNLAALMIADPDKADDLAVYIQVENVRRARTRAGDIPLSDTLLRVLPRIRARLYGIWGGRDAMSSPVHSREAILRRFQPDLDFRSIAGAGHWAPYERSEAHTSELQSLMRTPYAVLCL